jgi:hypothetical protein
MEAGPSEAMDGPGRAGEAELPWTALLRVQPPYIQHKGHGFKKKKPTSKGKPTNR